jgi:hypothetical protein
LGNGLEDAARDALELRPCLVKEKFIYVFISTKEKFRYVFISVRIKPGLDKNNMFWRTEQSDLVKLTILVLMVLMLMDGKNRVSSSVG